MVQIEPDHDAPIVDQLSIPDDLDPTLAVAAHRLTQRYTEIVEELREDVPDTDDSGRSQFSNHLAEDASDAQEWQSHAALTNHLLGELQQLEHAYARLQNGIYGKCENCGRAIPPRRLEIIPSASLCVKCQEIADQRH
jgi:RNA polymerase-binding transcription factor DksA